MCVSCFLFFVLPYSFLSRSSRVSTLRLFLIVARFCTFAKMCSRGYGERNPHQVLPVSKNPRSGFLYYMAKLALYLSSQIKSKFRLRYSKPISVDFKSPSILMGILLPIPAFVTSKSPAISTRAASTHRQLRKRSASTSRKFWE